MRVIYRDQAECPPDIKVGLDLISEAAGLYRCSEDCPSGIVPCYCQGYTNPWRIADEEGESYYPTAEAAAEAARQWAADMAADDRQIRDYLLHEEVNDTEEVTSLVAACYAGEVDVKLVSEKSGVGTFRIKAGRLNIEVQGCLVADGCPLVDVDASDGIVSLLIVPAVPAKTTSIALRGFYDKDVYDLARTIRKAVEKAYTQWRAAR